MTKSKPKSRYEMFYIVSKIGRALSACYRIAKMFYFHNDTNKNKTTTYEDSEMDDRSHKTIFWTVMIQPTI